MSESLLTFHYHLTPVIHITVTGALGVVTLRSRVGVKFERLRVAERLRADTSVVAAASTGAVGGQRGTSDDADEQSCGGSSAYRSPAVASCVCVVLKLSLLYS